MNHYIPSTLSLNKHQQHNNNKMINFQEEAPEAYHKCLHDIIMKVQHVEQHKQPITLTQTNRNEFVSTSQPQPTFQDISRDTITMRPNNGRPKTPEFD